MGSLTSKQSSGNTVTTRNHPSGENSFQQFSSSLRRSLRIKNRSTNASDGSRPQSQLSPSDLSTTPSRVKSGLSQNFQQPPRSATAPTPPAISETVNVLSTLKVAPPPVSEPPKVNVPQEEVNKAMDILKGAIEAKGEEVEKVPNKKSYEGGEKVEAKADEGRLQVENILSRLAPADKSGEQSPEVETVKKPAAASLLAALEKRKAKMDGVEKIDSHPSPEVSNVLESIAAGSAAIRSHEAASLMATFTVPPPERTEATSKVVEAGSKADIPREEVNKAMDILKGAIEAKGEEVEKVPNKKSYEGGEKVEAKADEGRLQVENILSRLAPADKSGEQSPEVETVKKPAAASLLAALEKRKAKMDGVEKIDSHPSPEVSNVLESIAAGSAAIRSHEAASLMAALTSSPERTEAAKKSDEKAEY
ncbi:unnamed protein product [Hymenolepis diminuta]|uniref:WH2 domain-containing protein n=1 Tax=Hymenolepis diminuta TaxID=6216 RepID=A0A0R3SRG6_HYMDI|nr:unnamed protein product [Hymenolepis diminuta]VUZ54350.1 unnamed protein product [Hymenolepis diminuta]